MAQRRKSIRREPLGGHVETLEFWSGRRIISSEQNVALHEQMSTLHLIQGLMWNVDLGIIRIRDVPLSVSMAARTALEGMQVLNGTETLMEKH